MNIYSNICELLGFYFKLTSSFIDIDNGVYMEEIEQFHISY